MAGMKVVIVKCDDLGNVDLIDLKEKAELHKDNANAKFLMDRIKEVNLGFYKDLNLENERSAEKTLLSDLIDLHTFNQIYKEDKK